MMLRCAITPAFRNAAEGSGAVSTSPSAALVEWDAIGRLTTASSARTRSAADAYR